MTRSEQPPSLEETIERLYLVFRKYPLTPGFPLRCSPLGRRELAASMAATELHALGTETLAVYAFKAITTMGDLDDFKYFLPRMLELYARDPAWQEHLTNLPAKLAGLVWRTWPEPEPEVLETFFRQLWQTTRTTFPSVIPIQELLDDLLAVGFDLDAVLADWQLLEPATGPRQLAELVLEVDADHRPRLLSWLAGHGVAARLEDAYLEHADDVGAERLAEAADWLRCLPS